jgi:hypothetical protein
MLGGYMTHHGEHAPGRTCGDEDVTVAHHRSTRARKGLFRASRPLASALGLAAVLCAKGALGAAFDVADTTWEGCSELYGIAVSELGDGRVKPVAVLDWNEVGPSDGVLVLHPLQSMDPEETTAFMKAGGRLAIVDDYGRGDETLRRFHIERTSLPSRPVAALRNNPNLAIAEPVLDNDKGQITGPHPVVAQVQQFVTNHATGLRHPNLSPVLEVRAIGEPAAIVAVAGQVGKGRLFALSDPSGLMNQMLRYPGNRSFAQGLCRYLVDADGVERTGGRLFIVSNRFSEEGSFGGQTTLRKDLEGQLRSLSDAIAEARRAGMPGWAHLVLAVLATLGVGVWVARASGRPYKSPTPRYARRTPLVAQGGVAGRFALLAAPTSPPSLVLLELKSALAEALAHKLGAPVDQGSDALLAAAARAGGLDEQRRSALKEVLTVMQQAEASVVAGRPAHVPRAALRKAATVVRDVLRAAGLTPETLAHNRALGPNPAHVPIHAPRPPAEESDH